MCELELNRFCVLRTYRDVPSSKLLQFCIDLIGKGPL